MKLTTAKLRQIIKEELQNVLEGDLSDAGRKIDPTNPMYGYVARQRRKNRDSEIQTYSRPGELPFPLLFLKEAFMELMYKPSKKLLNYLVGLVKQGKDEEEIKQVIDKHAGGMKEAMGEDKQPMPPEMEAAIMRDLQK
jgi:hypothetical protein